MFCMVQSTLLLLCSILLVAVLFSFCHSQQCLQDNEDSGTNTLQQREEEQLRISTAGSQTEATGNGAGAGAGGGGVEVEEDDVAAVLEGSEAAVDAALMLLKQASPDKVCMCAYKRVGYLCGLGGVSVFFYLPLLLSLPY